MERTSSTIIARPATLYKSMRIQPTTSMKSSVVIAFLWIRIHAPSMQITQLSLEIKSSCRVGDQVVFNRVVRLPVQSVTRSSRHKISSNSISKRNIPIPPCQIINMNLAKKIVFQAFKMRKFLIKHASFAWLITVTSFHVISSSIRVIRLQESRNQ